MFEPIYSLPLMQREDGAYVKAPAPLAGATSFVEPLPLGVPYSDVFRKNRAPSPRELVQQLVGVAYACATLNADLVASTRLRLYVRTRPGESAVKSFYCPTPVERKTLGRLKESASSAAFVAGNVKVEELTQHPLLDLLKRPNPDPDQPGMCGFDLRWLTQLHLESVGRAYWLVERDGLGLPRQLWVLRPHLVQEVPDPTGKKLIDHYQYGGAAGASYSTSEIIKFHFPDPYNPYFGGYSPMAAAIEKIRIGRKEEAHLGAMLDNMGRPDAVWSPRGDSEGGGIGAAEAQRVRGAFRQAFAMAGRGGLLVSEFPGTIQPLQWAPQDIVEIQRALAIKTDICNVFGVPDAKLERNAASLAGAKTADYAHTKDAGVPRCARSEETLNARLVPMFDPSGRLFVAYDSPVRDDEVFVLEQTRTASLSGAITRNEVRAAVGLDPVVWGEQPLVPGNMVEVDALTGKPGMQQRAAADHAAKPQAATDSEAPGDASISELRATLTAALDQINRRLEQLASRDGANGSQSTEPAPAKEPSESASASANESTAQAPAEGSSEGVEAAAIEADAETPGGG